MTRLKASTTAQSLRQRNTQALTRHTEQKSIFRNYVFTDGTAEKSVERRFAEELDGAKEVCVYAKLPKGFAIPTPVGSYSPDWRLHFMKALLSTFILSQKLKEQWKVWNLDR